MVRASHPPEPDAPWGAVRRRCKDAPQPQQSQARAPSTSAGTPLWARRMRLGAMGRQVYLTGPRNASGLVDGPHGCVTTLQTQGEVWMPCISGLRIRSCAARGTPSLTPSCTTRAAGKSCNIWGRVGRAADGSIPFAIAVILRPASGSIGRSPRSEGGPLPQARIPVQHTPVRLTDHALSDPEGPVLMALRLWSHAGR